MDTHDLEIRVFDKPSTEWARFVMNNRSRSFTDFESLECNFDNKYDIVVGPVANDDMSLLFRQFSEGLLSIEILAREMEYRELTNQPKKTAIKSKYACTLSSTRESRPLQGG